MLPSFASKVCSISPRPIDLSEKRIGFDEPAGACDKGAFLFHYSAISAYERPDGEFTFDRCPGLGEPAFMFETKAAGQQKRRIEPLGAGMELVALLGLGPAVFVDPATDAFALLFPSFGVAGYMAVPGQFGRVGKRQPAAYLGERVVLPVLQLPDAGILLRALMFCWPPNSEIT